jgi:ferredoxin
LRCFLVVTDDAVPDSHPSLRAQPASLSGHLGEFRLSLQAGEQTLDLSQVVGEGFSSFDIVLDLGAEPLLDRALPPVGYLAPGSDARALEIALEEIPELVGEFEKPQFFVYDAAICAHSRSGIQACTRCIDSCPADAITSAGDQGISVDPHLCQGAGSCASACPSGAIRYAYPQLGDGLERIRDLLGGYRNAGGTDPVLVVHDAEAGRQRWAEVSAQAAGNLLPLEVAELGSLGMDQWLSALAFGARRVTLLDAGNTPRRVLRELKAQLEFAGALLEGMGYPPAALALADAADAAWLAPADPEHTMPDMAPAAYACMDEKRTMIRFALDHLWQQAPRQRPLISLPTGAPFGEVSLVDNRCTLCLACVSQCPAKALLAGDDSPQLRFVEDNCIQCGLCARSCPENAIAPSPRYLFDGPQRRKVRVLKEEAPFLCIRCGKPFATRSVIDKISGSLRGHPNFGPAEFRRIQMCEDCRVKDMFQAELDPTAESRPEARS